VKATEVWPHSSAVDFAGGALVGLESTVTAVPGIAAVLSGCYCPYQATN
jgi:hypothetical protein